MMKSFPKMLRMWAMVACLAFANAFAVTVWDGTADVSWYTKDAQSYTLTTAEQLAGLAQLVNNGNTFEGKTITLGADIFLNDTTGAGDGTWASNTHTAWTPIGTSQKPFKGEFDGLAGTKKRKIYGLYINNTSADYVGLFGYTSSVKISNVDLLVGSVTAKNDVGALIGHSLTGSVTNVHAEVKVTGTNHVGGLVGYSTGSITRGSVTQDVAGQDSIGGVAVFFTGNITGTAKSNSYFEGTLTGRSYVGGIAGYGNSISNAYSKGNITGTSGYVGGIVGFGAVKNSYSSGAISGGEKYVGGVSGYGDVDSSYHENGDVSGLGYVGGITGYGSVSNSYNVGSVIGKSNYVGGVSGYGSVSNSYNVGSVIGKSNYVGGVSAYAINVSKSYCEGSVTGDSSYVGGVVGFATGTIDSSFHIGGNVIGCLSGGSFLGYVGGVAGRSVSSIRFSYNKEMVSCAVGYRVGGVVGSIGNRIDNYANNSFIVLNSYSEGKIVGNERVGGVVGEAANTVIDSSYHENGDVSGLRYIGGVVGYGGQVSHSYSKANVKGREYVGGVAGKLFFAVDDYSFLDSCYHTGGNVSGDSNYVGGVVGYTSALYITNSYHDGGNVSGYGYVGGVAGYNISGISNSYSEGTVVGISSCVGGIAGCGSGSIDSSYHKNGAVSGVDSVGGIAGSAGAIHASYATDKVSGRNVVGGLAGSLSLTFTTDNSYFSGDSVIGIYQVGGLVGVAKGAVDSSYASAIVKGDDNVGGLIGSAYADVSNSYAMGNVFGDVDNSSAGNDNLGGLVGYAYSGSISKSMATGDVAGTTKLGGLVGRFDGMSITQSYANGNVTGRYDGDPANEVGNYYIGGLVGYGQGTVDESYASGVVKGIEPVPVYTGCLIGYVNGSMTITKSYYDSTKCKIGVEGVDPETEEGFADISGAPAQTTAAMQTQSTFIDWNFDDVWNIDENTYPYFMVSAASSSSEAVESSSSSSVTQSSCSAEVSSSSEEELSSSSETPSSSSVEVSSSSEEELSSSSSEELSSSSEEVQSSSSEDNNVLALNIANAPRFSVEVIGRNVQINAVNTGASYAILDMQGHVLHSGKVNAMNVNIALPSAGSYLVRIGNQTSRVNIK